MTTSHADREGLAAKLDDRNYYETYSTVVKVVRRIMREDSLTDRFTGLIIARKMLA